MQMIHQREKPAWWKIIYARFLCENCLKKENPYQCRITVSGHKSDYPVEVYTKNTYLTTINCILNSVVSKLRAQFITADFFKIEHAIGLPWIPADPIPHDPAVIMEEYNSAEYENNRFICFEIIKGMYGLTQAGLFSNKLIQNSSSHTYFALHCKHWACGDMTHVQYNSPLWYMNSEPSTFKRRKQN